MRENHQPEKITDFVTLSPSCSRIRKNSDRAQSVVITSEFLRIQLLNHRHHHLAKVLPDFFFLVSRFWFLGFRFRDGRSTHSQYSDAFCPQGPGEST